LQAGRTTAPFLQPVGNVVGLFLVLIGGLMLIPAAVDWYNDNPDWQVFCVSASVVVFVGMAMFLSTRAPKLTINRRQGFVLTTALWLMSSAASALPFMFSQLDMTFTDGFFEAMSGFTTTGATVISGLASAPPGILVWRALMQCVGGVGFVAVGLAMLPFLRVGGMQLFRTESSEKEEKPLPQMRRFAASLLAVYGALTLLCAILLYLSGMTHLEAVVHAMTALSTGGFSTSDGSVGHFDSWVIQWILVVFMLAGSMPLLLFLRAIQGRPEILYRDEQVQGFLAIVGVTVVVVTIWLWWVKATPFPQALTLSAFNIVSIVTTTGFASADYTQWGAFALCVFFVITFVGGCSGSTAGAVKVFRFIMFAAAVTTYVKRLVYPHARVTVTYNGRMVGDDVIAGVLLFIVLYLATWVVASLLLAFIGLDLVTSLTGAATAIGNVGPGLGEIIGPVGNFDPLPDAAKWVLSISMMLGRLELFTVFTLFYPGFWRQ
jgi:trk system potassium uptake protein TrkH